MNRSVRWIATLALTVCWSAALAGENVSLAEPVKLKFDPRFIMETVARRMNVALSPELPLPAIFVESTTPLSQFQDAMEAQWRFRPPLVSNAYAIARNEIYLSDSPGFYRRLKRTLDDSLAHEFVHYIQAKYFDEDLSTDGCEMQAAEVQRWFREIHVQANPAAASRETGTGNLGGERYAGDAAPSCVVVVAGDGSRTVRCATGSRPGPG